MNQIIGVLFSIALFDCCISCKKDNQQVSQQIVNIHVEEYKSHAPVPDAHVDILVISTDIFCACAVSSLVETLQTDADGICPIPESYFNSSIYGISITKNNFWPSGSDLLISNKPTSYELQRKGQLRVHLIKSNSYTDSPIFYLNCSGELPGTTITPFLAIPLPTDSTFTMDAYGGQTNQVSWKIMTILGDSLTGGINPIDVLATGITDMEIRY